MVAIGTVTMSFPVSVSENLMLFNSNLLWNASGQKKKTDFKESYNAKQYLRIKKASPSQNSHKNMMRHQIKITMGLIKVL